MTWSNNNNKTVGCSAIPDFKLYYGASYSNKISMVPVEKHTL